MNVNKIATLRNSRGGDIPNLIEMTKIILKAGAHGITVHPREDERHIKRRDVFELKEFLNHYNRVNNKNIEYNIEGEPSSRFEKLVLEAKPTQVTLVPVTPGEITSDHGFVFPRDLELVIPYIKVFQEAGIRVSLFVEREISTLQEIEKTKTNRIEFYTGPFADAFSKGIGEESFLEYKKAAEFIHEKGIEINAGHDLDIENLKIFRRLPYLKEVSIGHRLISQALEIGLEATVKLYLQTLAEVPDGS